MAAVPGPVAGSPGRVVRRLRSHAIWELVNVPLQAGIWFAVAGLPATVANLVGFGLLAALLVQGAGYWLAKLRQLRLRRGGLPGIEYFQVLRVVNVPLLVAGVVVTGYAVVTGPGAGSWPGLCFVLFATVEYVSYFWRQLMHDSAADLRRLRSVGLRPSHLARDLRRAAGPAA